MGTGVMNRIKVVNDVADLVSILHAVDTDVKKQVFDDITKRWVPLDEIEDKYGDDGREALLYLEKNKLVETQWETTAEGPRKVYHTYYSAVQINVSIPIMDIGDILYASTLNEKILREYEDKIKILMGDGRSVFIGEVIESLGVSQLFLKSIVKRSNNLEIKGQRVELVEG